jgi:hypothetical protein
VSGTENKLKEEGQSIKDNEKVLREGGWGNGREMTQTLYAYVKKRKKLLREYERTCKTYGTSSKDQNYDSWV